LITLVYFKHFSDPEISELKAFKEEKDAIAYKLELALKWYAKKFSSELELELWLDNPEESADVPGRPIMVSVELN
jgi:hypothetical protein